MRPYSLLASILLAAAVVGCAAPRSAPPPVQSAQGPSMVRSAQIVAVEGASAAAVQPGATSSSGSTGGTVVGSSPTRLTVRFADGTEGLYDVAQPAASFRVGQPVSVITSGSAVTIVP
jgi:outer membrane lipoprotein SlyB